MKPSVTISEGVILIKGDLVYKYRNECAQILKKLQAEHLSVVISEATSIDLSYLQLLLSTYFFHKSLGRSLTLQLSVNDQDKVLLERTGFKTFINITD